MAYRVMPPVTKSYVKGELRCEMLHDWLAMIISFVYFISVFIYHNKVTSHCGVLVGQISEEIVQIPVHSSVK